MNAPKAAPSRRLEKALRKRGWNHRVPPSGLRRRLYCLASDRRPWWDWGHRLMVVTGVDWGGSWSEPQPPTWWYRLGPAKHQRFTGFPRHPLSTYEVVKDYDEFRGLTKGLNEDQLYEWQAMNMNQDGELQLGHRYWGGSFFGLRKSDVALLRRYLRMWHRLDWWGLRSWLYSQGLHAAVHARKPRACKAVPPPNTGGYSHWYCHLKRGHDGMHRFNNYVWGDVGGEVLGVVHAPETVGRREGNEDE